MNNSNINKNLKSESLNWGLVQSEMKQKLGTDIFESWLKKIDFVEEFSNYILLSVPTASTSAIGAARLGERVKGIIQETLTQGGVPYYDSASVFEGGTQRINKTFNLGSGVATSVIDICKAFNIDENLKLKKTSQKELSITKANISKIKNFLSWRPKVKIKDSVKSTQKFIRFN